MIARLANSDGFLPGTPKKTSPEDKYVSAFKARQGHVDAVLESPSRKKIVVAGPGTGKTHLFKKILSGKRNTLTLTFINALVEDLSLELCGLSDVKTLHGFARAVLGREVEDIKVFPKLSEVIKEDAEILLNQKINFDRLFHDRDDRNIHIQFYRKRRKYYDYYGFSDIIFAVVKLFEKDRDKIPSYEQVVVDEFQDFNKLEVSLIELLSEKSPVLLVGDDDQALYDFKSASPGHIRKRHSGELPGYTSFGLPYCSRSTRVIVEAANDVVRQASANGFLKGRIRKQFRYFDHKTKDRDSAANPKIGHTTIFATQIPWFIQKQIVEIAKATKDRFSVLIISPTKNQSRAIVDSLREKGFMAIESVEKKTDERPTLLNGLEILLEDYGSNLGWRIVAKFVLDKEAFDKALKRTYEPGAIPFVEIIGSDVKKRVKKMVQVLRAVKKGETTEAAQLESLFRQLEIDPHEMAKNALRIDLLSSRQRVGYPGVRKIPIKASTIESSKGLAAEYVFITHLDDLFFIKDDDKSSISDRDICKFLVALTRAKTKVFLISTDQKSRPSFLKWIDKDRIEPVQ